MTRARSATLLVVEDEPALQRLYRTFLESEGYIVRTAPDAECAMAELAAAAGTISLLLTDLQMPGLSGLELADWVIREHPDISVILMSGHLGRYSEEKLAGYAHVLSKPFSLYQLLDEIAAALGRRDRAH